MRTGPKQKTNFLYQLYHMARCDFKCRDQGSILGFFWTLLNPVLTIAVLYTVFSSWFRPHIDNFSYYLIIGVIQWNFFSTATLQSVSVLIRMRHLILNLPIKRTVIVISRVLTILVSYLLELLLMLAVLLVSVSSPLN